jgi:hypothetical protein
VAQLSPHEEEAHFQSLPFITFRAPDKGPPPPGSPMINVHTCSCKIPDIRCPILMKLEFSRKFSEKYSNTIFHENPSSGSRVVPCGQTDRHDEANSRFSRFLRTRLKRQPLRASCCIRNSFIRPWCVLMLGCGPIAGPTGTAKRESLELVSD